MTSVKHAFTNPKADGADATITRPSDWNADHVVQAGAAIQMPNYCLNGDFARATTIGLAMQELLGDTNGMTQVGSGTAPSVASNILTFGAATNEPAWAGASFAWRDGRASASFKATLAAGIYEVNWRISSPDAIKARMNAGTFYIIKKIAAVESSVASVAQALTVNRWYWPDIEKQNTTIIAKIYDTGGTSPGVTKASSTLLQTLTGTVADASVQVGAHVSVASDQAAAQWGGIASGNGGVYVETYNPESFSIASGGTVGGAAFGLDDSTDAFLPTDGFAPAKQHAFRMYIPATSRQIGQAVNVHDAFPLGPSTTYTVSAYVKVSGKTGSGALVRLAISELDAAKASVLATDTLDETGQTTWTRISATFTTNASTRFGVVQIQGNAGSAAGTGYLQCIQVEQGSVATAWRNAPADDGPMSIALVSIRDLTGLAGVEADPSALAANVRLPWDATIEVRVIGAWQNSGANTNTAQVSVDGVNSGSLALSTQGTTIVPLTGFATRSLSSALAASAGKHRIALWISTSAGTATLWGGTQQNTQMLIVATRGK